MELREILRRRRMVRHYTGEPVPRETLERIVATVRRAPSAGFSQGQRLLVVDEPELLGQLAPDEPEADAEPWFATAAAHVLVLTREQDYHDRIPDELRIVAGVTLGPGAPDLERSKRTSRATQPRRGLDELVHWNHW